LGVFAVGSKTVSNSVVFFQAFLSNVGCAGQTRIRSARIRSTILQYLLQTASRNPTWSTCQA